MRVDYINDLKESLILIEQLLDETTSLQVFSIESHFVLNFSSENVFAMSIDVFFV